MTNMFDYISWRGDLSFAQSPFNPADNIIFSQLSYLPLDNIVPGPKDRETLNLGIAAEKFARLMKDDPESVKDVLMFKDDPGFMAALGSAPRFRNCSLSNYVNHIDISQEKQFSALTIDTGDGAFFIAFRGTDSSIVGWKEDFNMSFSPVVPAQIEAAAYLENTAKKLKGALRTGGHSKGGNLAVYAASFCSPHTRRRIKEIYCNDGPGFHKSVIESEGYKAVRDRIYSYVPQSSVIGMLFEHEDDYIVIKSSQTGLMQHDLYSWELMCNDMVHLDHVTQGSRFVDKTLKEWIASLNSEQRQQFTGALYSILGSTEATFLPEIAADWFKNAGLMIQGLKNIDESTRELLLKSLGVLLKAARNNIDSLWPRRG